MQQAPLWVNENAPIRVSLSNNLEVGILDASYQLQVQVS